LRAFDGQKAQFSDDTARGGETAGFAAGGQHTVAGHNDRRRVFAHGLTDRARQGLVAEPFGDLAIGHGRARRDRARDGIDALVEIRLRFVVDGDAAQIALFADQQSDDAVDCPLHGGRRYRLVGGGMAAHQARARRRCVLLRQLHAADAARAPDDAAGAEGGLE